MPLPDDTAPRTVLVAGASGALGRPLVAQLLARGYHVVGLIRSPSKRAALERQGVQAVVADVLDQAALSAATAGLRVNAVVHALTAIPPNGPLRYADMDATNALREQGTANLLALAAATGARRFVAESVIIGYGYGDWGERLLTEAQPLARGRTPALERILAAIRSFEAQVGAAGANGIDGIVVRFGYFYGVGAGSDHQVQLLRRCQLPLLDAGRGVGSWIAIQDAASATVAALERGRAGETYNVVDNEPVRLRDFMAELARATRAPAPWSAPRWLSRLLAPHATAFLGSVLRVSNEKAKRELGWTPTCPTYREGIARVATALREPTLAAVEH